MTTYSLDGSSTGYTTFEAALTAAMDRYMRTAHIGGASLPAIFSESPDHPRQMAYHSVRIGKDQDGSRCLWAQNAETTQIMRWQLWYTPSNTVVIDF